MTTFRLKCDDLVYMIIHIKNAFMYWSIAMKHSQQRKSLFKTFLNDYITMDYIQVTILLDLL